MAESPWKVLRPTVTLGPAPIAAIPPPQALPPAPATAESAANVLPVTVRELGPRKVAPGAKIPPPRPSPPMPPSPPAPPTAWLASRVQFVTMRRPPRWVARPPPCPSAPSPLGPPAPPIAWLPAMVLPLMVAVDVPPSKSMKPPAVPVPTSTPAGSPEALVAGAADGPVVRQGQIAGREAVREAEQAAAVGADGSPIGRGRVNAAVAARVVAAAGDGVVVEGAVRKPDHAVAGEASAIGIADEAQAVAAAGVAAALIQVLIDRAAVDGHGAATIHQGTAVGAVDEEHAAAAAAAAAGDGLVAGECAPIDGDRPIHVHEGAAHGVPGEEPVGGGDAAIPGAGDVAGERAAGHARGPGDADGSAAHAFAAGTPEDLIRGELAIGDRERGSREVVDRPALDVRARAAQAHDFIVGHDVLGERQRAVPVQDGAAAVVGHDEAVGDGQAGDGRRHAAADVEDPAGTAAADGQSAGPGAFDVQVLGDGQLAARQRDGLAVQALGELDRVAAVGRGDRGPEGPGPAVEVVQDRQGAEDSPLLEPFEPRPQPGSPAGRSICRIVSQNLHVA